MTQQARIIPGDRLSRLPGDALYQQIMGARRAGSGGGPTGTAGPSRDPARESIARAGLRAAQSRGRGVDEVGLEPQPRRVAGGRQISTGGGGEAVWCPSGELFYRNENRWMSAGTPGTLSEGD